MNHLHTLDLPDSEQLAGILRAQKTPLRVILFMEFVTFLIKIFTLHTTPSWMKYLAACSKGSEIYF